MHFYGYVCPDSSNFCSLVDQVLVVTHGDRTGAQRQQVDALRHAHSPDHRKHCLQGGVNLHFGIMVPQITYGPVDLYH